MSESLRFGFAVALGYLISFGFSQVQATAYQVNLESQNKTIKVKYLNCQTQVKQIKGVVEKW